MDWNMADDLNSLVIRNATMEDEGEYRLEAVNESGSESVTVMVTVDEAVVKPREQPKIEVAPEPVEFREGETFTLSCRVSGKPVHTMLVVSITHHYVHYTL